MFDGVLDWGRSAPCRAFSRSRRAAPLETTEFSWSRGKSSGSVAGLAEAFLPALRIPWMSGCPTKAAFACAR